MNTMKRRISLILAVLMILTVSACKKKENYEVITAGGSSKTTHQTTVDSTNEPVKTEQTTVKTTDTPSTSASTTTTEKVSIITPDPSDIDSPPEDDVLIATGGGVEIYYRKIEQGFLGKYIRFYVINRHGSSVDTTLKLTAVNNTIVSSSSRDRIPNNKGVEISIYETDENININEVKEISLELKVTDAALRSIIETTELTLRINSLGE